MQSTSITSLRGGRYRVEAHLGAGGMADVFRVYDTRLATQLAVKVLKPEIAQRPKWRARFIQEAQVTFQLRHPGIVQVLDVVDDEDPPYLVMELIRGSSLLDLVAEHGPMKPSSAIDLMLQLCDAIAYAHGQGVVHRDLNPRNCLLDPTGRVKVVDFGIAVRATAQEQSTRVGTDAYMPPEQRLGRRVDGRADIYALGASLFVLLTERRPPNLFEAFAAREVRALLHPALAEVVVRATQFLATERYASAEELAHALREARVQTEHLGPLPRPGAGEDHLLPTVLYETDELAVGTLIPEESLVRDRRSVETRWGSDHLGLSTQLSEEHPPEEPVSPEDPEWTRQEDPASTRSGLHWGSMLRQPALGLLPLLLLAAWMMMRQVGEPTAYPPDLPEAPPSEVIPAATPVSPATQEPPAPIAVDAQEAPVGPADPPSTPDPQRRAPPPAVNRAPDPPRARKPPGSTPLQAAADRSSTGTPSAEPPPQVPLEPPAGTPPPVEQPPKPVATHGRLQVVRDPRVEKLSLVDPNGRVIPVHTFQIFIDATPGLWTVLGVYPNSRLSSKDVTVLPNTTTRVECGETSCR